MAKKIRENLCDLWEQKFPPPLFFSKKNYIC